MKKVFTLVVLCLSFWAFGQINVGPGSKVEGTRAHEFDQTKYKKLKKTTTYFVYGEEDEKNLEEWKAVMKSSWKFTPIDYMPLKEFLAKRNHAKSSYLMKTAHYKLVTQSNSNNSKTRTVSEVYYAHLSLITIKGKKLDTYCRIDLYPDYPTIIEGVKKIKGDNATNIRFLYNEAKFFDWYPGLLKNQIALVSDRLQKNAPLNFYKQPKPDSEISALASNTLYIPDYTFIKNYNRNTEEEIYSEVEEILEDYPHDYQVVSAQKLSEMILADEDVYVLLYSKCIGELFINVWRVQGNKLLYKDYKTTIMRRYVRSKDFKKLAKAIRKAA